jgi:hypothetical protein
MRLRAKLLTPRPHTPCPSHLSHAPPPHTNRTPAPTQRVCASVFQSKRAAYDSKAHAVPEEAQKLAAKPSGGRARGGGRGGAAAAAAAALPAKPANAWEQKSAQLREAMRASRAYSAAVATGAPLPPMAASEPDPSLVPCSNCGRSFSEKAAERHIPKCAGIVNKVRARCSAQRTHARAQPCAHPLSPLHTHARAPRAPFPHHAALHAAQGRGRGRGHGRGQRARDGLHGRLRRAAAHGAAGGAAAAAAGRAAVAGRRARGRRRATARRSLRVGHARSARHG